MIWRPVLTTLATMILATAADAHLIQRRFRVGTRELYSDDDDTASKRVILVLSLVAAVCACIGWSVRVCGHCRRVCKDRTDTEREGAGHDEARSNEGHKERPSAASNTDIESG